MSYVCVGTLSRTLYESGLICFGLALYFSMFVIHDCRGQYIEYPVVVIIRTSILKENRGGSAVLVRYVNATSNINCKFLNSLVGP